MTVVSSSSRIANVTAHRSLIAPSRIVVVRVAMWVMRVEMVTVVVVSPGRDRHEHGVQHDGHRDKQCQRLPFRWQIVHHAPERRKRRAGRISFRSRIR